MGNAGHPVGLTTAVNEQTQYQALKMRRTRSGEKFPMAKARMNEECGAPSRRPVGKPPRARAYVNKSHHNTAGERFYKNQLTAGYNGGSKDKAKFAATPHTTREEMAKRGLYFVRYNAL